MARRIGRRYQFRKVKPDLAISNLTSTILGVIEEDSLIDLLLEILESDAEASANEKSPERPKITAMKCPTD